MELDKICRLCLTIKKDMRNIFTENLLEMITEISNLIKIENNPGWPEKICVQCLHQVSRCHSFKKRIEKSDEQLKNYIKSLTVIVEEPVMKEMRVPEMKQHQIQPQMQEIQIQRPPELATSNHPLIIMNNHQQHHQPMRADGQCILTANGQIIQAQYGQFIQGPNNTIQMITGPTVAPQQQLLQLRSEPQVDNNRCELIVQPSEMSDAQFFDEMPVIVQSANGQQTILNLPHHQVQALQQQIAQQTNNNNQQQQQQQQQQQVQIQQVTNLPSACSVSESDEIEIQDVSSYVQDDELGCEDLEEIDDEPESEQTFIVQTIQEEDSSGDSDADDRQLLAEFLAQQTHSEPGKHICNLCNQEFKHKNWLHSHMKSIHNNWIKANCKKQPQCSICFKSFRGPGMLKMHMKTHEKENKLPTCTICSKEFKSKSILYRHRATHFSNQKEHRCSICDKSFSSNYQLNAHMQRHTRNHQCSHCEKTFASAGDLKTHAAQQHAGAMKVITPMKTSDVDPKACS